MVVPLLKTGKNLPLKSRIGLLEVTVVVVLAAVVAAVVAGVVRAVVTLVLGMSLWRLVRGTRAKSPSHAGLSFGQFSAPSAQQAGQPSLEG